MPLSRFRLLLVLLLLIELCNLAIAARLHSPYLFAQALML